MTESRHLVVTFADGSQLLLEWIEEEGEALISSAARRSNRGEVWSPPEQIDISTD